MPRARLLLLCLAAMLAAGCETRVGLSGATGSGGAPTGVAGTIQPAIVGEWSMILINQDMSGNLVSSSETRWRFDADGTASRMSVATSFVSGIQETVRTTGRWSATATTITITLLNPPSGTLVVPWRVERNGSTEALVLGTLRFARRS